MKLSADHHHLGVILNGGNLVWCGAQTLDDGVDGDDISLGADGDNLSVDDGECQGQPDCNLSALVGGGADFDFSIEGFDVFLDDVHSDAPAGDVGDLVGGGEARTENQSEDFLFAEFLVFGNESFFDGFFTDFFAVEAASVVFDFDNDTAGLMIGGQSNASLGIFPFLCPLLGAFNAVID